jgi:hypothetical protein
MILKARGEGQFPSAVRVGIGQALPLPIVVA